MQPISFGREIASVLLKVFAVILTIGLILVTLLAFSFSYTSISDGSCNIAVMRIEGVIMPFGNGVQYPEFATTPNDVRDFISALESEIAIEGVLFEINSPGGTPVASETIASEIANLSYPNIALIGDMAASGGYLIAASADQVMASAMSDVGSIGVTMSYLEESQKNIDEGYTYVPLNSGKYKDTGSPYKPLTAEERTLLETQLTEIHEYFVDLVSQYRALDRALVAALADGSTVTGTRAKEAGLIDAIGGRTEVKAAFAELLGKSVEEIEFCEYSPLPII